MGKGEGERERGVQIGALNKSNINNVAPSVGAESDPHFNFD